MFISVYCFK